MTELDAHDRGRVLTLIEGLCEATDVHALIERTLLGLLDMVPALSASWNECDLSLPVARAVVRPDPGPAWYEEHQPNFSRLMHQNPLVSHFERTGDTRVLRWSDVDGGDEFESTELYQSFYRPLGIHSQLGVTLPSPPGTILGVVLNGDARGFDERDRGVLGTLRPHLVSAYRRVRDREEASLLRRAVRAQGWTVALVDWAGRLLEASEDLAEALRPGERLPSRLLEVLGRATQTLAARRRATGSEPVDVELEGRSFQAWVTPSEIGPHVLLLRPAVTRSPDRLRMAGLTPREVEVALALADGGTNQQIAERLSISVGTVRKHLERVFLTLGVGDRVSAAAKIRALQTNVTPLDSK